MKQAHSSPTPESTPQTSTALPRLYDVPQAAAVLGMSNDWVRDHASGRRLPKLQGIKLGARGRGKAPWKFLESDLLEFLMELRKKS